MELGQVLHNNPVGVEIPDYVEALIYSLRDHLSRAYWNTQGKVWEGGRDYDLWQGSEANHGLNPLPPGIEWRHYYNWAGSPEDSDWNQSEADAPNFSFEGVEIRWYKRFGRSMNVNTIWTPNDWMDWYNRCLQTIRYWEYQNCSALQLMSGNEIILPDPDKKVPLKQKSHDDEDPTDSASADRKPKSA